MSNRTHRGVLAACVAAAALSGCVLVPMHVYVADADAGAPVYERCSLTPELPIGVKIERPRLQAIVSLVSDQSGIVRVRFDVPEGTTATLRDDTIQVDARDGTPPHRARIPHVNPAAPARVPETPVIQKLVVPPDTPMRGGRLRLGSASSDKHYWIAARLAELPAGDVWITLPELSVDETTVRFEAIHFVRRFVVGRGLFNC